jgi:hypothetical protein
MLSIIVFVNLFSRNKVLSFSFFINLFIIIFFGDDLIHYTLILFILSFCLFIFIISSNINYSYPILCKCLFGFTLLLLGISAFIDFSVLFLCLSCNKDFFYCFKHYITLITGSNQTSSSSFTSARGSSGGSGGSGSGGSGGTPNSNNTVISYFSGDNKTRRDNYILSWLEDCLRAAEVGTLKANNPLKNLIYRTTTTGPSSDQGPSG